MPEMLYLAWDWIEYAISVMRYRSRDFVEYLARTFEGVISWAYEELTKIDDMITNPRTGLIVWVNNLNIRVTSIEGIFREYGISEFKELIRDLRRFIRVTWVEFDDSIGRWTYWCERELIKITNKIDALKVSLTSYVDTVKTTVGEDINSKIQWLQTDILLRAEALFSQGIARISDYFNKKIDEFQRDVTGLKDRVGGLEETTFSMDFLVKAAIEGISLLREDTVIRTTRTYGKTGFSELYKLQSGDRVAAEEPPWIAPTLHELTKDMVDKITTEAPTDWDDLKSFVGKFKDYIYTEVEHEDIPLDTVLLAEAEAKNLERGSKWLEEREIDFTQDIYTIINNLDESLRK